MDTPTRDRARTRHWRRRHRRRWRKVRAIVHRLCDTPFHRPCNTQSKDTSK